jgi:hypothetical protein
LTMQQISTLIINSIQSYDTTGATQVINAALISNCTSYSVIYCSSLKRLPCGSSGVTAACGECLAGYVSATGATNTKCVNTKTALLLGDSCVNASQCVTGGCALGICSYPFKSCLNNCTSPNHGLCKSSKSRGRDCYSNDTTCYVYCVCKPSYASSDCSLSQSEAQSKTITNNLFCEAMSNISKIQDSTVDNMRSTSLTIYVILADPNLVSVDGTLLCVSSLDKTLIQNKPDSQSVYRSYLNVSSAVSIILAKANVLPNATVLTMKFIISNLTNSVIIWEYASRLSR